MGHRHGRLRFDRRHVSQLRRAAGRGSDFARGYLRCRPSAPSGSVAGRAHQTSEQGWQPTGGFAEGQVMSALDLAKKLKSKFGDLLSEPAEFRGEITLKIADANRIAEVCGAAKQEFGFDYLVDITSIDNYGEDPRFTIAY